mgnify:CR=1 FL=1
MLNGIDISRHNVDPIRSGTLTISSPDFVIMKATEGKTYRDPLMYEYLELMDLDRQGLGFYHYARPEINNPVVEALNFVNRVGTYAGRAMYALDVENKAFMLGNAALAGWVLTWLQTVENETGVKPIVYTGTEGLLKFGNAILANDTGLWFARYRQRLNKEMYAPYPFWAIWQFTSNPWDCDKFNGDRIAWAKYIKKR